MSLSAADLRASLGPGWPRVEVVAETGSTNADLLADAAAPDHSLLVAEYQSAGRGRLGRTWSAPVGAALTFSVLIRPQVPPAGWGWLPLLAGVALRDAVTQLTGVVAGLKWPNDLLAGPERGKAAGILVQTAGPAAVIGIGLNVSTAAGELPAPPPGGVPPTSLALCAATGIDRGELLVAVLTRLDDRLRAWTQAAGDAEACGLARDYRAACLTLGQSVSVAELSGGTVVGTATAVDAIGRLVVATDSGAVAVSAGDVRHLRSV